MYPDERRVENTFIEIEVNNKAVRFVNNDSIHKRHSQHLPAPLIPLIVVQTLSNSNMIVPSVGNWLDVDEGGIVAGAAGVGVLNGVVCSARFVRGPQ